MAFIFRECIHLQGERSVRCLCFWCFSWQFSNTSQSICAEANKAEANSLRQVLTDILTSRSGNGAGIQYYIRVICWLQFDSELDMGPNSLTQPDPTHLGTNAQLVHCRPTFLDNAPDPTHQKNKKLDPTQPNITNRLTQLWFDCRLWDHTVFPAGRVHLRRVQPGRYSIYIFRRDRRLSWSRWLGTRQDGLPVNRQSYIQVVTGPNVD